jgi:hypothetical protein
LTVVSSTAHGTLTGREIYGKQRIDVSAGAFTSSPWAYNGRIFCLSRMGTPLFCRRAEYRLIGKNSLGEMCLATPAIARGSLFIRTASNLYRITRDGRRRPR